MQLLTVVDLGLFIQIWYLPKKLTWGVTTDEDECIVSQWC